MTAAARARMLPYGRQTIGEDDIAAVAAALRADLLTTGPLVEEFETAFAQATGARYAVACNSGTAALHLAVVGGGLGPGEVAVVPSITFIATANVVRMTGAEVVFADVDAETGLLTEAGLDEACARAQEQGRSVKAALPVHLNGLLCDMPALADVAAKRGIALIEDACHALGVPDAGAAGHSQSACFSTHPVKAITTGEGGVLTTCDEAVAQRARDFRSHGMTRDAQRFENRYLAFDGNEPNPWYYEMPEIGWNYRLPDILCALGRSQLRKLPDFWRRRCEIAALYDKLLKPLAPAIRPVPHASGRHGWHLYVVLIDFPAIGRSRAAAMKALRADGIGTQVHYLPVNRQPYYRHRYGEQSLPNAEAYYARCLSLPMFPTMTDADVKRVAAALSGLVDR